MVSVRSGLIGVQFRIGAAPDTHRQWRSVSRVRRMIDDDQVPVPPGLEQDETSANWAVTIVDDYDDATAWVSLVIEAVGSPGTGLALHLDADRARRLRLALANALAELGESSGR